MSRARSIAAAGLLALLATSCRLSDPVYAFRDLSPADPAGPEMSLLSGTIQAEPGLFSTPIHTIIFRRVHPGVGTGYVGASDQILFRVFLPRTMKDGTFLLSVPPGVYELDRLEGSNFWMQQHVRYVMNEASRVASRIYVTRPGLYDLGTLRITSPGGWFQNHKLEVLDDAFSPDRLGRLKQVLKGTPWEKRPLAGYREP